MTKSRDNKQAIRAYMKAHGVNYTTAKRALAAYRDQHTTLAAAHVIQEQTADDLRALSDHLAQMSDTLHGTPTTAATPASHGRDTDGFSLTIRRAPVYLDPRTQADQLARFLHVHDLNGQCLHNRDRTPCAPDPATPRPTPAAVRAATKHNISGAFPVVFMDPTIATNTDRVRAHHAHTLDGTCIKHRTRTFCPPPTVNLLHDHNTPPAAARVGIDPARDRTPSADHAPIGLNLTIAPLTGGLGTGEPVTPSHSDRLRTAARATSPEEGPSAPAPGQFCDTHFSWLCQAGQGKCGPTGARVARGSLAVDEAWAVINRDHAGRLDRSQRALDVLCDGPVPMPSRRDDLKAALRTGNPDILNAHLRAHAPGPHIDDLHAALEQLANLELALREHTCDPESPVTYEMLRHAILATTTHGERWGGGHGFPSAADVCRSYLLAVHVTTDTPDMDGQYPVAPADLAGILEAVADDDAILETAAEGTAVHVDDLAEELLILANALDGTLAFEPPTTSPRTADDHHYLVVTTGDRYVDRRYKVECANPATGRGSCEGWEECPQCTFLGAAQWDAILDTGEAHGQEHIMLTNGPAIATGRCALIAFPEAWEESDAILSLPPGRYAISHKWDDEYCTLTLRTH